MRIKTKSQAIFEGEVHFIGELISDTRNKNQGEDLDTMSAEGRMPKQR